LSITGKIFPFHIRDFFYSIALYLLIFAIVFTSRIYRLNNTIGMNDGTTEIIYLHERTPLNDLANLLFEKELIQNKDQFLWASRVLGWRNFQTGRYEINEPVRYREFLSKLGRGIQDPALITILPGTDIQRLSLSLSNQLMADSASFASIFYDSSSLAIEFGLNGQQLFGRMLPDSYSMYWTSRPEAVVRRIYNEFNSRVINRYQSEIAAHNLNIDEIVALAAIIEWEARIADEKPTISGLYQNRLRRNWMLQADPTVNFALGERRRLLFEDYRFEHPYNTYMNRGLPPGPITNPDLRSIESVLFPESHNYMFMVATPDGGHEFTVTYEDHQVASERWRRWLREQIRIRDQREALERENSSR
jgi:UPF0755 protein